MCFTENLTPYKTPLKSMLFTNKKTETHKYEKNLPVSYSYYVVEPGFKARSEVCKNLCSKSLWSIASHVICKYTSFLKLFYENFRVK